MAQNKFSSHLSAAYVRRCMCAVVLDGGVNVMLEVDGGAAVALEDGPT
ncbi:MAG: hypothetical protein WAK17_21945 [Candidatus Nitrosopolaris sp.]